MTMTGGVVTERRSQIPSDRDGIAEFGNISVLDPDAFLVSTRLVMFSPQPEFTCSAHTCPASSVYREKTQDCFCKGI